MNKSEIAELVARRLWLIARGFAPDDGPERLAKTIEIVQMAEIVERAIAESQVPRGFDDEPLTLPDKCEYCLAGKHRYHGVEISRTGTTLTGCYFCHCKDELGDGEPSPPPGFQVRTYHTSIRQGETLHDAICRAGAEANGGGYHGYSVDCSKCGWALSDEHTPEECAIYLREFGKRESGAAQEVSPPSPERRVAELYDEIRQSEGLPRKFVGEFMNQKGGDVREPRAATVNSETTGICDTAGDASAKTRAEGDTRELKAALTNLVARLKIVMDWPEPHFSHDLPIEIRKELAEAERILLTIT